MRITLFLGFPVPFPGAAWVRIKYFADFFLRQGHIPTILSAKLLMGKVFSTIVPINNYSSHSPIKRIAIASSTGFPCEEYINGLFAFISSFILFIFLKSDLIMISVPPGGSSFGVYLSARLHRMKIVFDFRDEWEDFLINNYSSKVSKLLFRILKKMMTLAYLKSDLVISVTSGFARNLGCRGVRNVLLAPNGADTRVFYPAHNKRSVRSKLNLRENDFVLVYSGSFGGYSKLDLIVKAIHKVIARRSQNNVKLIMIGTGSVGEIIELAAKLGIDDQVEYLGIKDDSRDVAEIISCADVGIIPNLYSKSQLPVKFFEYCACGVPVIAVANEDSSLAKLVTEHRVGLVVQPREKDNLVEALVEAISRIYEDKSLREVAGSRARSLIKERFDRNKISKILLNRLEQVR